MPPKQVATQELATAGIDARLALTRLVAPEDVVAQALDAVENGLPEVLADDVSRQVKASLAGDLRSLYPAVAG